MKDLHDWVYSPPFLFWALLALVLLFIIARRLRTMLEPVIDSMIKAAQSNVLLFALAFALAASATSDSVAECFAPLTQKDMAEMGWWQIAALGVKAFKPMFATIAALLINPPAIKVATGAAKELAKTVTTSAPPFNPSIP